jgi:hypothetical protein
MNLGAEPKKVAFLGGLLVFGGYLFYSNVLSHPSAPPPRRSSGALSHTSPQPPGEDSYTAPAAPVNIRRATTSARATEEFRPSLKLRRGEQRIDPMTIDPTLRLDLLAKVQAVEMQGASRNLFAFSTPPPPPLPKEPKVPVKPVQVAGTKAEPSGPPKPPPPPPIMLKYYGYSSARGAAKRAFFLDGDDILVASEGEVVKRRYKVVRIGVNSVVMEDTQFKHEQTLPLQEEAAG